MNHLLWIIPMVLIVGSVGLVFGYEGYNSMFLERYCSTEKMSSFGGGLHTRGWCSVIDSQQKIIEQNDEIIKQLKISNCLNLSGKQSLEKIEQCDSIGVIMRGDWVD